MMVGLDGKRIMQALRVLEQQTSGEERSLQSVPEVSEIDQMLALEQRFFLSDHNLNYIDKMSMAECVEVRVPFLDPDLLNIAASIPSNP